MEELHRDIISLQRTFRDWLDEPNSPLARQLDKVIQRLEDDIQVKKNPGTIEPAVRQLINELDRAEGSSVMSIPHLVELQKRFETLQNKLRKLM